MHLSDFVYIFKYYICKTVWQHLCFFWNSVRLIKICGHDDLMLTLRLYTVCCCIRNQEPSRLTYHYITYHISIRIFKCALIIEIVCICFVEAITARGTQRIREHTHPSRHFPYIFSHIRIHKFHTYDAICDTQMTLSSVTEKKNKNIGRQAYKSQNSNNFWFPIPRTHNLINACSPRRRSSSSSSETVWAHLFGRRWRRCI